MSDLILPPHLQAEKLAQDGKELATQLPQPKGYKLLCAIPEIEEAFESGLIKADITKHHEELMTTVLFVVSMGPDAYADKDRFPNGPYCKVGDFVLVRPYSGTRVKVHNTEFRIISDDMVEAVVENPVGIKRC